ncbi:MAG: phosphoenolpyruvate-protein phosphotransferase [Marmoricola sp.]|nr:phosphoenolpyruvate-protein phosphotransferase [Marmoricola sp.]
MRELQGVAVSPGSVAAPVLVLRERPALPPDVRTDADAASAVGDVERAIASVAGHLEAQAQEVSQDIAAVLQAQALIVGDPTLLDAIKRRIGDGSTRTDAVEDSFSEFREQLAAAGPYFADRIEDLDDLSYRIRASVLGVAMPSQVAPRSPRIIVADELAPADLVVLGPSVVGLVTQRGGATGHTAIVAKSLGIPAVVGCAGACELADDTVVLLDGGTGVVVAAPTREQVDEHLAADAASKARIGALAGAGRTADGTPVALLANLGGDHDVLAATDCEGVGLFRTEFLFLDRDDAPSFDEQVEVYTALLRSAAGRRVVFRTLDAGSDKPLGFVDVGHEPNPALGVRGYRIAAHYQELVDEQLRAVATAEQLAGASAAVMAPMVATVAEVRSFVAQARAHGLREVGVMAEVPALVLSADRVLAECDFLSIGTNDLAQYTFAADRQLDELAVLLDPWQPALLRLVSMAAEAAKRSGKSVSVCGEAASDPLLALVLAGIGVSSLSMAPVSIPAVRAALFELTMTGCQQAAQIAVGAEEPAAARAGVRALLTTDG